MASEVPVCDQVYPLLLGLCRTCQMTTVGITWQKQAAWLMARKPQKRKKRLGPHVMIGPPENFPISQ